MLRRQLDLLVAAGGTDLSPAHAAELSAEWLRDRKLRPTTGSNGLLATYRALAEPADAGGRMMPPS